MTQNIKQLTEDEVAKMHSQGIWRDQSYVEGVGWCVEDINSEIIGRSPDSMQVGRPIIQSDGNVKFINPHPAAIKSGLAPEAEPEDAIDVGELKWSEDNKNLLLPVDIHFYPDNRDELLGMVESKDPTRGGWLTMSALEALGSGLKSSYTETVRNATEINFVIRSSYSIEKHDQANFQLYFRKSNEKTRPEYIEFSKSIPVKNTSKQSIPEPQASFLSYASESQHGYPHQLKWARVLLATGYQWEDKSNQRMVNVFSDANQEGPMEYKKCIEFYERHGRNKRWTLAKKWFEDNILSPEKAREAAEADKKYQEEMHHYHNAPPVQGNYSAEQWRQRYGRDPVVALVKDWGKYIIDPQVRIPLWGLDGDFPATEHWEYDKENDEWIDLDLKGEQGCPVGVDGVEGPRGYPTLEEINEELKQAMANKDWSKVAELIECLNRLQQGQNND